MSKTQVQEVTKYVSADKREWSTAAEAQRRNIYLDELDAVGEFINGQELGQHQVKVVLSYLTAYAKFKHNQEQ